MRRIETMHSMQNTYIRIGNHALIEAENALERRAAMEVFLIFPKSKQAQQELGQELAKFQSEQALKNVQKLPCSTEQKLELVDAAVKHLKAQQ